MESEAAGPAAAPPSRPRQAAAVVLVREADQQAQVLLVQRTLEARFMPGVWVFPGGAAADDDGSDDDQALRATALRELREEASIVLSGPQELVPFTRWITPPQVPVRFDTTFYLALAPAGQTPCVDNQECVQWRFLAPAKALEEHGRGELSLAFPTIRQLRQLSGFAGAAALISALGYGDMAPIEPRIAERSGEIRILMPEDPDYPNN